MSKKSKKRGLLDDRFYRIYFAVLAAALVLILIGTVWLMGYLREYESAQPVYVARDVAKLFEDGNFEALYAMDSAADQIAGGDRDFYVENMNDIARGKTVEWSEAFSAEADVRRYNVTLDGERFATFTLVPSGRRTRRGHPLWTLGSVVSNVAVEATPEPTPIAPQPTPASVAVTQLWVTVPQGYTVTVDGATLSPDNADITEKPMYEEGFLPENVVNPTLVTYGYGAATQAPAVSAVDETGMAAMLTQTGENTWSCGLPQNTGYQNQYTEAVLSLGEKIARYTSKDGSKDAILKYCAKDSPARNVFNNLSNQYATPHSEIAFQNEHAGEFYALSADCFTCRVTFDYMMKTRDGVKTDPTAYTFCIVVQEGTGKLYNLLMS